MKCLVGACDLTSNEYIEMLTRDKMRKEEIEEEKKKEARESKKKEMNEKKILKEICGR